jgi:hypothetical protein
LNIVLQNVFKPLEKPSAMPAEPEIRIKLVTFTETRIYKILMDISILTVYNVCMSLFVGDCFPVAGISITILVTTCGSMPWTTTSCLNPVNV